MKIKFSADLTDKVLWAIKNERKVLEIVKNAQRFTRENLLPKDIYCYHVLLLKQWSQNLVDVRIQPHMDRVPIPVSDCDCHDKEESHLRDEL